MLKQKHFKFAESTEARLDTVATALSRNHTDVVVMGIRVIERLVGEVQRGSRPAFIRPDGRIVEYDGEWGEAAAALA